MRSVLAYPGDPDAAVTVLDPRTGYVRAMVGGDEEDYWADPDAGRVNLATGMGGTGRQTGSAFKPFALVAALEHGISPDTLFAAPSTSISRCPTAGSGRSRTRVAPGTARSACARPPSIR